MFLFIPKMFKGGISEESYVEFIKSIVTYMKS